MNFRSSSSASRSPSGGLSKPDGQSKPRQRIFGSSYENSRYLENEHTRIINSRSVEHPFLNWYRHHELSEWQQRLLFSECYCWFRHLPFYIAGIAALTRDTNVLKEITFNIHDEVCGEKTHALLYVEFLKAIGLDIQEVRAYKPCDQAVALNSAMQKLYSEPPLERALGALFYDEAMSAVMVSKVNDGLRNQGYDAAARYFWETHIEVEIGHSNSVFNAIYPYVSSEIGREMFEDGAYALERLVENYWDAVTKRLDLAYLLD